TISIPMPHAKSALRCIAAVERRSAPFMIIAMIAGLTSVLGAAQRTAWPGSSAPASEPPTLGSRVTYSPSQEIIPNPERGFFHASCPFFLDTQRSPVDAQRLSAYRTEGITLFRACYVLDEFSNGPISRS